MKIPSSVYQLFLIVLPFMASCGCTKEDCINIFPGPDVFISMSTSTSGGFQYATISRINKMSGTRHIDTMDNVGGTLGYYFIEREGELSDYQLIITTAISTDTIANVQYERYAYSEKCNDCYPFGHQNVDVTNFRNFSYQLNGITHAEDTLRLIR